MEKKEHLIEITYHESGNKEVITLNTDDLAWSMTQYQRNRLPLTWELLDIKEKTNRDYVNYLNEVENDIRKTKSFIDSID